MERLTATVNDKLNNKKPTAVFKDLFTIAVENKLAVALWRHPNQKDKHLIIDVSNQEIKSKVDLEEIEDGFLISPFDNEDQKTFLIRNHIYFGTKDAEVCVNHLNSSNVGLSQNLEKYLTGLNVRLGGNGKAQADTYYCEESTDTTGDDKHHYINMVNNAIAEIKRKKFAKVVPSRTKTVRLADGFDIVDTFEKLCDTYNNALISVVAIPGIGTWIGATPEQLISVDKAKIFTTVALAGTQEVKKSQDLYEVAWRQKEIEEQAMVSRYIINCFKKIRLREFDEQGPRTARAGNVAHLKTDFLVDTVATNFPQLGTVMLELLHPTSAVCGMPKMAAQTFLKSNELHKRSFFSGFLGPVNIFGETHLYVNIRCLKLSKSHATLYAGAGVTEISDPYKEWEETELKLQTLLAVL